MGQAAPKTADPAGMLTSAGQFLTFVLGEEQYGIEILKVQEIKGYSAITPIPNTPAYIKGVINLRGTVVPVVDLRAKFSLAATEYNKFTVIIVVTVGEKVIGMLVDAVSDVMDIAASEMRTAPDLGVRVDTRFISGMATVGERMTVLLDIDRLLSADEAAARASRELEVEEKRI
ncbi:MAG TPA: chemotaxis protein CheW [Bryobacteraceae bacterium]|nr:chemotaxis protein CheW [Bryobacteraceae bacterium]